MEENPWALHVEFKNRHDGHVAAETLASVFDDLGAAGWTEKTLAQSAGISICVFFPGSTPSRFALTCIRKTARSLKAQGIFSSLPRLEVAAVEHHDWVEECRRGFRGIRVSRRLRVVPPWRARGDRRRTIGEPIEIVILPGMAFGTGLHETTRLCLRLMEKEIRRGERVADVGAGSGILSIAAIRLGARSVRAIESDAQAYENFDENLALNRVSRRIRLFPGGLQTFTGSRTPRDVFDLIVCNILFEKMRPLLPCFSHLARRESGATAIISGYLWSERDDVLRDLASAGIRKRYQMRLGDWGAVVGRIKV